MEDPVRILIERDAIIGVIHTLFTATDAANWDVVKHCLAERVLFDMSSLTGEEPRERAADEIVAEWDAALRPLEAVHHQVGNHRVDVKGTRAEATCYGIACHYLPNPTGMDSRVFVGSYAFDLVKRDARWRIHAFRFDCKFVDGNRDLEASAQGGAGPREA